MTSITISETGLRELGVTAEQIAQLHQKLNGDLTEPMEDIGTILMRSSNERFVTKLDPDGNYWANLMPSTVERKGNDNILVKSGELSEVIYHAYKDRVEIGTPEIYGVYHQFGAKKRNGEDMPARPFLGISSQDETDIYKVINKYLQGD